MTESLRRRTSKWDVVVEPQVPVKLTDTPLKVDSGEDSMLNLDWNSSKCDSNTFSLPSEMKDDPTMMRNESSDTGKLTELLQRENVNARLPKAHSPNPDFPKPPDMDAGDRDYLKYSHKEPLSDHTTGKDDFSRTRDKWNKSPEQNYVTGLSPSRNAWRQRSPAISPKRSWSRSHRSRSRSRGRSRSPSYDFRRGPERSRSRSPPYDSRRGPERWPSGGRMGSGPAVTCRDFGAGRCQRGSECRFLHEDSGQKQSNRYYDSGASDTRKSRGERGRYSEQGRENFRDSREQSDYPRDRLSRNDRSTTRCYDFIKGRCHRGSECRYAHHEASSYDSGRGDEARELGHDRRDAERRLVPPRRVRNDTPCKFFAEGCCRRGEACSFSHQVVGSRDDRSGYSMGIDVSNSSWNSLTPGDQPAVMGMSGSSQQMGNDIDPQVGDSRNKSQHSQSQVSESNVYQNWPQEAINPLAVASVPGQSFGQGGQSQYIASQPVQAQSITPNVQIQQLVPPVSLNGQMQQAIFSLPQNGQGQFIAPQAPSNFNIAMQNLPVLPPSQIAQNQQNYNMPQPPHSGQNQQNFNLSGQILQNLPVPLVNGQNGQNQLNVNFGGQSHETLPPPQDRQNQNVAPQPPNPESFSSNEQVMQKADTSEMQPSNVNYDTPITPKVVTSEQAAQITNLSASLARFFGSAGPLNPQIATGLVPLVPPYQGSFSQQQAIPSPGSAEPENPVANNLPPGFEQKDSALKEAQTNIDSSAPLSVIGGASYGNPPAKSVDLEVKVMQVIEDAAAKEVNETETVHNKKEQAGFEQKDSALKEAQTNIDSSAPLSVIGSASYGNPPTRSVDLEVKVMQAIEDAAAKEVKETETVHNKKEQAEDTEADVQRDEEDKQSKEAKGMRMFKCALVEFVKDVLKPSWKEGHLSKEAHKTIVKKVVEKVTGAMQSQSIPQTQEKIVIYMSHSKVKLTKLVQAYVDKYVKA